MNILISGVNGFLGSYLAKSFVEQGHFVIGIVRQSSTLLRVSNLKKSSNFVLAYLEDGVKEIFIQYSPINVVIHTATNYGRGATLPFDVFIANEFFPLQLLQYSIEYDVEVFVNTDTFFTNPEFSSYHYLEFYKRSKKNFLEWGKLLAHEGKIKFVNMRLEQIYGPSDDKAKFTEFIMNALINNVVELDLTLGDQQRDFIFIEDVVRLYSFVLDKIYSISDSYVEFEVGTGKSVSIKNFVEIAKLVSGSKTKLNFGAIPYRKNEIMHSCANIKPILNLGYVSKFMDLETGIKKFFELEKQYCERGG